mgnify:FL=1
MAKMQNILVLLDGSQRSMMTVDYISRMPVFRTMGVILYHAFSVIPESYWDLEKHPASAQVSQELKIWEKEKRHSMDTYMERARTRLIDAGFDESAVMVKINDCKQGVARYILQEAEKGYDAILLRRRGMTELEGLSMGSVASKLLSKITFLPIQVAGQKEPNNRILIGVDGSEAAVQAVDYVASLVGGYDYAVGLIHVIRGIGKSIPDRSDLMMSPASLEMAEEYMYAHFSKLRERLLSAGVKSENITQKIVTGAHSRSGAIVMEAEFGNYSTIAVGRRGHSKVQEFAMGRVCQKVVQIGRYHTVWII